MALMALMALTLLALEVPFLAGRVNDLAGMIGATDEARIEERLQALEEETGAQVVVLTIPSLEGENLEDYSLRVAEQWQLGQAEADNGVLLLIARDDRKMRLEVGYGLEGTLPDALCRRVLDDVLRPRFQQGDFTGGIEAGTEAVAGLIRGDVSVLPAAGSGGDAALPSWPVRLGIGAFVFGILSLFATIGLFSKGGEHLSRRSLRLERRCDLWRGLAVGLPRGSPAPVALPVGEAVAAQVGLGAEHGAEHGEQLEPQQRIQR
jgi:uncharacterized membrane protein YgcG